MLIAVRHSRLQEMIARDGISSLDALATELGVSQSTVRRDIEMLEKTGVVSRTHGGVIWTGPAGEKAAASRPYAFDQRRDEQIDAKRAIAKAARALVAPGQTVLLDGGTSTLYLAEQLVGMSVQLVTNSLPIANLFADDEQVEVVLTGGVTYPRYGVLLGPIAEHMIATIHPNILFLSVAGIHDGALYNQNLLLVQAERKMIEQAQKVVLLADSSKFGRQALSRLGELSEVDIVVTDSGVEGEAREMIERAACRLVVADV